MHLSLRGRLALLAGGGGKASGEKANRRRFAKPQAVNWRRTSARGADARARSTPGQADAVSHAPAHLDYASAAQIALTSPLPNAIRSSAVGQRPSLRPLAIRCSIRNAGRECR